MGPGPEAAGPGTRLHEVRLDEVPRDIFGLILTLLDADSGPQGSAPRVPVASDFAPQEVRMVVRCRREG